ncbi:MAG: hypothetical protein ACFFHD_15230 [Promethearchaeota archaeon]
MVWNPLLQRLNYIKCYNHYYRMDQHKQFLQDILDQRKKEEEAFDDWLSK